MLRPSSSSRPHSSTHKQVQWASKRQCSQFPIAKKSINGIIANTVQLALLLALNAHTLVLRAQPQNILRRAIEKANYVWRRELSPSEFHESPRPVERRSIVAAWKRILNANLAAPLSFALWLSPVELLNAWDHARLRTSADSSRTTVLDKLRNHFRGNAHVPGDLYAWYDSQPNEAVHFTTAK